MTDPWRHRCPEGHTGWTHRTGGARATGGNAPQSEYYCKTCQKYGGDPHFDDLVDAKDLSA